jgi:hypothetical protein
MGQYYVPTLIAPDGRMLTLNPRAFDNGAKLTEHSWISNELVNAALSLILESPKRVAWIGDYACDDYNPDGEAYAKAMPLEEFQKFYDAAWKEDKEPVHPKFFSKRDFGILDFDTKGMFLVNHDKCLYIDMAAFIRANTSKGGNWNGWCMNPLPLLTACGNGRGGGDYYKERIGYNDIGIWAFDNLEYTARVPGGYTEAVYYFDEHKEADAA